MPAPDLGEAGRFLARRGVAQDGIHELRHRPQIVAVDFSIRLSRDIRDADNEKRGYPRAYEDEPDSFRCGSVLGGFAGLLRFEPHPETSAVQFDRDVGHRGVRADTSHYLSRVDS